eukprot:9469641-Pyramimonas_sp.AAC.1
MSKLAGKCGATNTAVQVHRLKNAPPRSRAPTDPHARGVALVPQQLVTLLSMSGGVAVLGHLSLRADNRTRLKRLAALIAHGPMSVAGVVAVHLHLEIRVVEASLMEGLAALNALGAHLVCLGSLHLISSHLRTSPGS